MGGTQNDVVLEREAPRVARPARRRDEARPDQRADGAARKAQELLHLPHAVAVHYFLAAALRAAGLGAATFFAGFFSRLARSASMRSMTLPPPGSGASASVASWPSTLRCTAASMRARTSSV